jgi:hypothetical protein
VIVNLRNPGLQAGATFGERPFFGKMISEINLLLVMYLQHGFFFRVHNLFDNLENRSAEANSICEEHSVIDDQYLRLKDCLRRPVVRTPSSG